jgi:hypothetical protein
VPPSPTPARPVLRVTVLRVAVLAAGVALACAGCAKLDATLDQTWVDVTFKPSTSLAGIEKVRSACSHVPNVHPYPLPKQHTELNLLAGVRFNTTNATDAQVSELQECVQKFSSVQGFTPGDTGDEGS